ncbi:MAG: hypothetical protein Ct9H300mP11_02980 [Chloroflexota bacterium]|nr:MAG: hypothetical protein Ct9H300mP11_02980 [Chloroflexota bacterium]
MYNAFKKASKNYSASERADMFHDVATRSTVSTFNCYYPVTEENPPLRWRRGFLLRLADGIDLRYTVVNNFPAFSHHYLSPYEQ